MLRTNAILQELRDNSEGKCYSARSEGECCSARVEGECARDIRR